MANRIKKFLSSFTKRKTEDRRKCQITGTFFQISEKAKSIYRQHGLPIPQICPQENLRRKLAFVSSGKFYTRTCDKTGAVIDSVYPQNTQFPVYRNSAWWSADFDALQYGRDFSYDRMFVEQMLELWRVVPRPAYISTNHESCSAIHYVDGAISSSNLMLSSDVSNCHHGYFINKSRNCWDCFHLDRCDGCYECIHCIDCSNLVYSEYCLNCSDSFFLNNCKNCKNCIFCTNIDGGEYMIKNKKVNADEYHGFLARLNLANRSQFDDSILEYNFINSNIPMPTLIGTVSDKSTGNFLWDCQDCLDSLDCHNSTGLINCHSLIDAHDCIDGVAYGRNSRNLSQFALIGDGAENVRNSVDCWNKVSDLDYCSHCENSSHLFCCVGIRNKSFCIFNKQYSEKEYFELKAKIIEHLRYHKSWGHFFTPGFCGLAYNVSAAQVFMPLGRAPAKLMGFRWDDEQENIGASDLLNEASSESVLQAVPEELSELEAISSKSIFVCEISAESVYFCAEEISLYKEFKLAPPKRAPFQRHLDRISRMNRKEASASSKHHLRPISKKNNILKRV